ncbi:MAG: hypothetical protein JXM72_11565, partial [Deltaproteobacteria bacterium]|nr:hypothetical protein [Deltaproteobacteria bacterium]
ISLLKSILVLYKKGTELIQAGISTKEIASLDVVSEMVRLKSEVPNNEAETIDEYAKRLSSGLDSLKELIIEV